MICRCITWIKKHPVLSLFFLILMYLVIGATAPFYHYKPISQETQDTVSAENFYQEGDSRDRAMILETNQSAWDERMRLMNLARERIILSLSLIHIYTGQFWDSTWGVSLCHPFTTAPDAFLVLAAAVRSSPQ